MAIVLIASFDIVSQDTLISKIARSSLPPTITRFLSCYLGGRQAATSFRGIKPSTRIVRTSVPGGSKLSHSLFNYYIAEMPRPTPPVKSPKILGVIMDPSLSFYKHRNNVINRIDKWNNMLKALARSSWGLDKETSLLTYNALGNLSQPMLHQSAAPTQVTRPLRSYRQRKMQLWGRPPGLTRPSSPGVPLAECQGPLRHALCAVSCEQSGGGPRLSWHHRPRPRPIIIIIFI